MNDLPESEPEPGEEYTLWSLRAAGLGPMKIEALVNSVPIVMELDTGASVSIISQEKFRAHFPKKPLEHVQLKSYSGEVSAVLGMITVTVKVGTQEARLPLLVVSGACPTLFGRD